MALEQRRGLVADQHRTIPMAFPRIFSLPQPLLGFGYLAAYVVLDWISFIHPFAPYGITPWNPPTGLSFVVVLLFGQQLIPLLFLAPLLADLIVRQLPFAWPLEIVTTATIGGGYAAALIFLMRPAMRFNPSLPSMRDLFFLLLVAATSAAFVASSYVGVLIAAALLPARDLLAAGLRFWVGDMIGIAVVAPFALIFLTRGRIPEFSRERAAQLIAILAALALVFGYAEKHHFQLFYILFLPIIWMAVRGGLEAVTVGILLTQLGLILGVQLLPSEEVDITAFQALMLVLTLTGLMAGVLVTEHRRTELQLRLHQDSIARLARLGSMGELAAAVAHEINQPLMAAGTYARLVVDALRSSTARDGAMVDTAQKAAAQVERAAEVLKRLRALIRLDQSGRAPTSIDRIVKETLDLCQPGLAQHNVKVETVFASDLPLVMADLLQIEQVLMNIVRNSIEAIHEGGATGGTITIKAMQADKQTVAITVSDTGPGFPPELVAKQMPPLSSTKPEGLGIGLSLSRTIIEAHGGRLAFGGSAEGAVVSFTLPAAA